MAEPVAVSKRFDTPIVDSLKPMHRRLVECYCILLDKRAAAEAAGYKDSQGQLDATVKEIFSDPKIIAAIDEFLAAKLEQLDSGRAAICERLLNQSLANIWDVAKRVPFKNAHDKPVEGRWTIYPKDISEIEPRFVPAACFLMQNKDGTFVWDNMSQHRAATLLAKLMMWDQSILQTDPALVFNFGDIQVNDYIPPEDGVDLTVVDTQTDEVSDLTH